MRTHSGYCLPSVLLVGQFVFSQVATQLVIGHSQKIRGLLLVESALFQGGLEQFDLLLLDVFFEIVSL